MLMAAEDFSHEGPVTPPGVRFECSAVGCHECFEVVGETKAAARSAALKTGWDFNTFKTISGSRQEAWSCPTHASEIKRKIKAHKAKRLVRYSDDISSKDRDDFEILQGALKRHNDSLTRFERYFGVILPSAQMTACGRLLHALEKIESSGNAAMGYDGSAVDSLTFGAKTIQESVLDAITFHRRCHLAVAAAQDEIHWRVLIHSISRDFTPQEAGDFFYRLKKESAGEKKRRSVGVDVVQNAASAIIDIRY